MFRASSAHLQEDTVVHMQHMVLSLSMRGERLLVGVLRHPPTTSPFQSVLTQAVYRQVTKNSHSEWQYHMLHVHNCILLKMSTWGSKHVEENIILWINNNRCIKLVINIQSFAKIFRRKFQSLHKHCRVSQNATFFVKRNSVRYILIIALLF